MNRNILKLTFIIPEKATVESDVPYIEVSLSRARLRDVYKALLLQDLELALDQKVEQELWNNCYKEILINIILLNIFCHLCLIFSKNNSKTVFIEIKRTLSINCRKNKSLGRRKPKFARRRCTI